MGAREAIVRALLKGGPGGPHPGGIHVYHQSPHDFDRFDFSKIGTGEGAQTYGHGGYFAENPAVSGQGGQYWEQFARRFQGTPELEAAQILRNNNFDRATAVEEVKGLVKHYDDKHSRDILKLLESGAPVGPRTYEVNINARPELFLDWDKPITRQSPEVQAALERFGVPRQTTNDYVGPDARPTTGEEAYTNLSRQMYNRYGQTDRSIQKKYASQELAEAGIPGIRYLDQGSRPPSQFELDRAKSLLANAEMNGDPAWIAKQQANVARLEEVMTKPGTSNYVVFDPSKLDILGKYGVVGTAGGGLGVLAAQDQYPEAQ